MRRELTIHEAGPVKDNVQPCALCGYVLIDATGAMSLDGAPVRAWPVGARVEVEVMASGGPRITTLTARPANCSRATAVEE